MGPLKSIMAGLPFQSKTLPVGITLQFLDVHRIYGALVYRAVPLGAGYGALYQSGPSWLGFQAHLVKIENDTETGDVSTSSRDHQIGNMSSRVL